MPRVGVNYRLTDESVVRFAYARFMLPISNVRDTLGDFVNQYTGYAQTTTTLGLLGGRPQQVLANPYPANNPVIEPYGQSYGNYTGLGGAVSFDQYELRPQINDRFNVSYQRQIWKGMIFDAGYFFNWGTRVPYTLNLNMRDPAFDLRRTATLLNTTVPNPFRNYLTPDKFPGSLRNNATVTLGSLLVPYPQYGAINQTNTNGGRAMKTQSFDVQAAAAVHQRRQLPGGLRLPARPRPELARATREQYKVLTTGGEDGWEWQPTEPGAARAPLHERPDVADPGRPRPPLRQRHAAGARLRRRRLAVHERGPRYYSGRAGALHDGHAGQRQSEARQPDARAVVRHQHVLGAAVLHAAHEPGLLRRAQRAGARGSST